MSVIVAPSLLACDFSKLGEEIEMVNASNADWFHLDVMDGVFVPNISFGMPIIKSIQKHAQKTLDVHLMIVDPDRYIKDFKAVGADVLTVHYEACNHLHRTLQAIKAEGMKAGVAINPHTPVHLLEDVLENIDVVCVMSVNPGFGGQKFIRNTLKKVQELKQMIVQGEYNTLIEIDGGVDEQNAKVLKDCGADILVAGSTVFKSEDPKATIDILKQA